MKPSLTTETVRLDEQTKELVLIDQTKLPGEYTLLRLSKAEDIWEAIVHLRVRGAPAIGVAAAIGLYVVTDRFQTQDRGEFDQQFRAAKEYFASSRPTAVNLFWALDRMAQVVQRNPQATTDRLKTLLRDEAIAIQREDVDVCRRLGEYGLSLLQDGDGILTHCNAGQLATVKYGTALAPIHLGVQRGMHFHVYTDETRPLLQGIRLSAFEMQAAGVKTTVLCDNMASSVMQRGWVQAVLVGCDRVAANGDTANKIGTSGVAILANYYHIPFYVVAPPSTIDLTCPSGTAIPIEQRPPEEVTHMWYEASMAPAGVDVYNPAFDVTDHSLITAIVTEYGIAYPPYDKSLAALCSSSTE